MDAPFPLAIESMEPWRCDRCEQLMYNLEDGHPAPGAPQSHFWSTDFPKLCSVCYHLMTSTMSASPYWRAIMEQDVAAQAKRKSDFEKLSGRKDYFTGI